MNEHSEITAIGITNFRNTKQKFGIKDSDRQYHIYCIAKTGQGKSTLLANMALSDIRNGKGIFLADPHGDLSNDILSRIPKERIKDVIYFNPKDWQHAIPFNPLSNVHPKYHFLVASGMVATMKKVWVDSWGPRLEHILRHSLLTLLHYPHATLLDIAPLLTDQSFRSQVLSFVPDKQLLAFWENEFEKQTKALRAEAISSILNKVGLFSANLPFRKTVGQKVRGLKMQEIMDNRKILIANLSKGELGEDASALLGNMLITSIHLAALNRARQNPKDRIPFYMYIDEVQSFATLSLTDILSESKKFGLNLFVCHQFTSQLDPKILDAILGNVGTIILFRIGAKDAEYFEKEFHPTFTAADMVSLPKYHMYLKMVIDGSASEPFSAVSFPLPPFAQGFRDEIIKKSQQGFKPS